MASNTYFVLLILTDGEIHDMQVKHKIIIILANYQFNSSIISLTTFNYYCRSWRCRFHKYEYFG